MLNFKMKFRFTLFLALTCVLAIGLVGGSFAAKVTLRFWHHWGGTRIPLMEKMISDFEKKYPDIKVEATLQPWDRRSEKILTAVVGGSPPDVIMFGRQEIPEFVESNALTALDEYMEKDGVSPDIFYPGEYEPCVYKGKTWILPIPTAGSYPLVYFNRKMFKEAGLDPENPPETWAQLENAARKFVKIEGGKVKKLGVDVGFNYSAFVGWLYANGGKLYDDEMKTITFGDERGVSTLQWMLDFTNKINGGREALAGWVEPGMGNPFYTGYQAMQISGVWEWFITKTNAPDMDLGIFLRPHNEGYPLKIASWEGHGYSIPRGVKHPYESWKLVKYLTVDEEGAGWFMLEQKRPSPVKKYNENPKYYELHPQWDVVLRALELHVKRPTLPIDNKLLKVINDMLEEIYYGKKTVAQGLKDGQAEAQKLVDQYWAKAKR
ncbi:MAG: ABC transporter substrate-binding protein [bacterium]